MELTIDQALQKAIEAHKAGQVQEADRIYTAILKANPKHTDANHNMGVLAVGVGKVEAALPFFKSALKANPKIEQYWLSYIDALIKLDRMADAKLVFDQAKNIGMKGGGLDQIENKLGGIDIIPTANQPTEENQIQNLKKMYSERRLDRVFEEAQKLIKKYPKNLTLWNLMGASAAQTAKLDQAVFAFQEAIKIKPDYADAYNNMGIVLKDQGKLDEAIEAFNKALAIKPDNAEVWYNIMFPLQALKSQGSSREELVFYYPKETCTQYSKIAKSILNFRLDQGRESTGGSLNETLEFIQSADNLTIRNPSGPKTSSVVKPISADKVIALTHFGRSGTGLLHSLIDGHKEVSTLPSIYLSEYFDHSTWEKITAGGWHEMADRFVLIYEVLFDATSTVPIETKSKKLIYNIGKEEGTANVGKNRNEVLRVDKKLFRAELNQLMSFYDEVDAFVFFKIAHAAFNKAINDLRQKSLIFYHIHNPAQSSHTGYQLLLYPSTCKGLVLFCVDFLLNPRDELQLNSVYGK